MQWEEHGCGKACQVVGRRGRQEGRAGGGEEDGGVCVVVVIMGKKMGGEDACVGVDGEDVGDGVGGHSGLNNIG